MWLTVYIMGPVGLVSGVEFVVGIRLPLLSKSPGLQIDPYLCPERGGWFLHLHARNRGTASLALAIKVHFARKSAF